MHGCRYHARVRISWGPSGEGSARQHTKFSSLVLHEVGQVPVLFSEEVPPGAHRPKQKVRLGDLPRNQAQIRLHVLPFPR